MKVIPSTIVVLTKHDKVVDFFLFLKNELKFWKICQIMNRIIQICYYYRSKYNTKAYVLFEQLVKTIDFLFLKI